MRAVFLPIAGLVLYRSGSSFLSYASHGYRFMVSCDCSPLERLPEEVLGKQDEYEDEDEQEQPSEDTGRQEAGPEDIGS